ncbi:MAG TPA: TraB/GumN family protein, partial [Polyangia bacterium]
ALAATDGVALELRMDLVTQVELGMRLRAPHGQSVRELVPPDLRTRLRKLVETKGGSWALVQQMRPWMAAVMLSFVGGGALQKGAPIDVVLHDWAIDHGKPSDGLETVAEQATMGDGLTTGEQLQLLGDVVARAEKGKLDPAPLREAYFAGDERRTLALIHEPGGSRAAAKFERALLDERNARLAERIRARLQAGTPTLFAVGVAHVIGKGGIVERLTRAGYKLTRVR